MPSEEAKDFPHIELLDLWIHVTSIEKSIGVIYYLFYVVHWLTDRCAKTYHLLLKKNIQKLKSAPFQRDFVQTNNSNESNEMIDRPI